jgi:hypothetical protein
MTYVFSIGTEHQLFQVQAAIKHFDLKHKNILVLVFDVGDASFIKKIQQRSDLGTINIFKNWVFKDIVLNPQKHKDFIHFCLELKKSKLAYTFLSSHYQNDNDLLFLSIVKPTKYYLMDEGTASFSVARARQKHSVYH